MTQIAKYTIGLQFDLRRQEWQKLDRNLKLLEKKLSAFSNRMRLNISEFTIDQRRLNIVLRNAFRNAEQITPFRINNFEVDQAALTRQMTRAMRAATAAASRNSNISPDIGSRASGGITGRHAGIAGGVGGLAARAYMPLLAVAGGGYGLAQLNNRNQQIVSAQLQTSAIVQQAGGTAQQGTDSFEWLRAQGDRVGFNWLDAVPDYNKLISGLTGAGMSVGQGQGVFQGFSELARVNKLDKTSQNRLFRALSQVAGKDRLMSEELSGQIARILAL